jgi:cyclase
MPLTIGGGIKTIHDVDRLFKLGADKISINTEAYRNPGLINEVSNKYGSQAVVVSIDVKLENSCYSIYVNGGQEKVDIDLKKYIKLIEDAGVGEILINSIDRDGMMTGYDFDLLKLVTSLTNRPIIFSGGCGSLLDCLQAFNLGADAVSAASIFYYVGESIFSIKKFLKDNNINVRI